MISLFSPAKLNLSFRVLKKRPDGFHEIDSLFQTIDLGDDLTISLSGRDCLTCDHPQVPLDKANLILQALDLFRKKTGQNVHFAIDLRKRIPLQAGLGGGSSNAATTLWGVNHLLNTNIQDEILASWGGEIGSDVPFFFSRGRARCQGRGEILTSLEPVLSETVWIAKPKEGLATAEVYRAFKPDSSDGNRQECFNDLERAAFTIMPKLAKIKEDLLCSGFSEVHMSGSGTAFFCKGNPEVSIEGISMTKARFLFRDGQNWYKLPA